VPLIVRRIAIASIEDYLAAHNSDPKLYVWTVTAESIEQ
jgi:hypothetical protein